jgi:hypothetical protein
MKKSYWLFLLIIIYLLTLGIRIYWFSQKDGFNVDEALSVQLACYNDWIYQPNREYTGKEAKEIALCDNESISNVFEDIISLWKDNRDGPHTNLYYSFLRLSLSGLRTGDIKAIIFRGAILNLLFFTVSFIFFFMLMKLLFPDSALLQLAAILCGFLSTATISNTLLFRPYQIQETFFIIFCYFFFKTFDLKKYTINDDKLYINAGLTFSLSLIIAFTLLTGYYSIIFIGLFGLYVIFIKYKEKKPTEIIYYIGVLCLGLIFAQILYHGYVRGYLSYRASETVNTLFGNMILNIKSSMFACIDLLQRYFFSYPVIILCVLCLIFLISFKQKIVIQKQSLYAFIASMFYLIIVLILAPFKFLRFVMPVFPFFIFLPTMLIYNIKKRIVSAIAILLLCIFFSLDAINETKIENINGDKPKSYLFSKDAAVPVFVLNSSEWKYADLVPYFNDEQLYFFNDKFEGIQLVLTGRNEFYLLVEDILEMPLIDAEHFQIEQEFIVGYFLCKKIKTIAN